MIIKTFITGPIETNCYILMCEYTHETVIIDPGLDNGSIIRQITAMDGQVKYILLTHGHFDHCCGVQNLVDTYSVPILMHCDDVPYVSGAKTHALIYGISIPNVPLPNCFINDGDLVEVGNISLKTIHTPGHTPGCVCFYTQGYLFSGDTLFNASIGRTDLPGGNFKKIISGIKNKLFLLPDDTIVYPGHGEKTTIGDEKMSNPYVSK